MDQTTPTLSLPKEPREFGFFVGGKWIPAGERECFDRSSPAHDVPVSRIVKCEPSDLDSAVAAAREAFEDGRWSRIAAVERSNVLLRVAAIIRERFDEIAYWETLENGKPISQARAEVGGMHRHVRVRRGSAAQRCAATASTISGDGLFGIVTREPVGVVGIITPWNFPFLILCERVPYVLAVGLHHRRQAVRGHQSATTNHAWPRSCQEAGLPDGCL
jgi:betaine-aldehyde dehydrogenase